VRNERSHNNAGGYVAIDEQSTHYDAGGIETLDILRAKLTPEEFKGWLLGNMIKYSCRANFKGSKQRDIEKCAFYADYLSREQ